MLTSLKISISATALLMTLSLIMYQATLAVIAIQLIILRHCIGGVTRLMTKKKKINVALSFVCSKGMVDLGLGFLIKRFLPLNCDHF